MKRKTKLLPVLMLVIMINFVLLFQNSSAANQTLPINDAQLQALMEKYWNWWVNLPEDGNPTEDDGKTVKNNCVMQKSDSVIFLLNNFEMKNFGQDCQIPSNSSIFFPFYSAWCDNGLQEHYKSQNYQELLECALDDDRGFVLMEAWLDGKKIVDIQIDNIDIKNLKVAKNNLPQENYFKEIKSPSFYEITLTNKTQYSNIYEHPEEFALSPRVYQAVSHGFFVFIPTMSAGDHEIKYHTLLTHSTGISGEAGWDYESEVTYKLKAIE